MKQSEGKNNTIDQRDYLWQIQKLLKSLTDFTNPIALVIAGNSPVPAGLNFEEMLLNLPEVTQKKSPNPLLIYRLFRNNNPQKNGQVQTEDQFLPLNSLDEIVLQQLQKREIMRIERRKLVRFLFGKDTRKLYIPYYGSASKIPKQKPVVTDLGNNRTN